MPDWFYRTVSRPILFTLPPLAARNFALAFLDTLTRVPLGPRVIDFLGHMRPDPRLACEVFGTGFASPVGIGPFVDGRAMAPRALSRFGVGFLELGPIGRRTSPPSASMRRLDSEQAFRVSEESASELDATGLRAAVAEIAGSGVRIFTHVQVAGSGDAQAVVAALETSTDSVVLHLPDHVDRSALIREAVECSPTPVLVGMHADADAAWLEAAVAEARSAGAAGIAVLGSVACPEGGRKVGLPSYPASAATVALAREQWPDGVILVSGAVHEPWQAIELLRRGASLLSVDTGLIFTGPGLPKLINEAILGGMRDRIATCESLPGTPSRVVEQSWFWTALMGAGMLFGSVLALVIAATRIVLPYDEAFAGMTREQLSELNRRLLPFLAHDRVCLAGTMITVAVMQLGLSLCGMRRGLHFAQASVFISSFVGFGTFFLFLGYGYFDPFHAFVTTVLFQLLLLGVHCRSGPVPLPDAPLLRTGRAWRCANWGQLILIGHGIALVVAGLVISGVGVTRVFVPEDLEFLRTSTSELLGGNPKILSLVAHDRATFGGMLISSGLVLFLSALWGPRPRTAWLWWSMLLAVLPAYGAAIGVHVAVGYTNLFHLAPAFAGLAVFLVGEGLLYGYMAGGRESSVEG